MSGFSRGASERAIPCSRVARAMYPLDGERTPLARDWIGLPERGLPAK